MISICHLADQHLKLRILPMPPEEIQKAHRVLGVLLGHAE